MSAYGDQYKYMHDKQDAPDNTNKGVELNAGWRFGPANYWYFRHEDLIEGGEFKYGYKEKSVNRF